MELPQPRPFETEGRKPTHDFLSQYNHPNIQQDPRSSSQGRYLKTQDFLQPLERVEKDSAKEEASGVEILASEKLPPPAAPPPTVAQHVLPGGIGTYTISHVSYFNQRVPKVEMSPMFTVVQADSNERNTAENSNCSSYTSGGFTLWDESVEKKGQTRKENVGVRLNSREVAANIGQWSTPERPSLSSTNNHRNSFGSLSSPLLSGKKNQSFNEMIRSAKDSSQDDDLDDDEEFSIKKESSSTPQKDLIVKADGNKAGGSDQRPNTPRSKHSATEQRRRSKINDGFQKLRQLIPNSDQKRDKASFLLEVIEYIQFLQEKVNKFESSYQAWNHEPGKLMNWQRNNQASAEVFMDQPRGIDSRLSPTAVYVPKLEDINSPISQVTNAQNRLDLLDMNSSQTARCLEPRPGTVNKSMPCPVPHQPNFFSPVLSGSTVPLVSTKQATEPVNNTNSLNQSQPGLNRPHGADVPAATDKLKEHELGIDAGTISISSVYSQGLLKTLTQALQSSGVDLSQTSISVQIELAKNRDNKVSSSSPIQDNEFHRDTQRKSRPRIDTGDDFDRNPKKAKTDGN